MWGWLGRDPPAYPRRVSWAQGDVCGSLQVQCLGANDILSYFSPLLRPSWSSEKLVGTSRTARLTYIVRDSLRKTFATSSRSRPAACRDGDAIRTPMGHLSLPRCTMPADRGFSLVNRSSQSANTLTWYRRYISMRSEIEIGLLSQCRHPSQGARCQSSFKMQGIRSKCFIRPHLNEMRRSGLFFETDPTLRSTFHVT